MPKSTFCNTTIMSKTDFEETWFTRRILGRVYAFEKHHLGKVCIFDVIYSPLFWDLQDGQKKWFFVLWNKINNGINLCLKRIITRIDTVFFYPI